MLICAARIRCETCVQWIPLRSSGLQSEAAHDNAIVCQDQQSNRDTIPKNQQSNMPNPLLPPVSSFSFLLELLHDHTLSSFLSEDGSPTSASISLLPTADTLEEAKSKILQSIEGGGIGLEATFEHLVEDLVPALGRSSLSSRYYGFVTGE